MRDADNPLLEASLPRFVAILPAHAVPAIEQRLTEYQTLLQQIESNTQASAEDAMASVLAEIRADDALALAWSTVGHLHAVRNDADWRAAFSACLEKITAFYTARGQNRALQVCWKRVAERSDFSEREPAFQRMVEQELLDFRLSGIELPKPERQRFAEISMALSKLGNEFGNHVLDATEQWFEDFDDEAALAGLPTAERATLADKAAEAGQQGWRADLSHPCYRAIVTYADDRALRQRFYTAHCTRASSQGPQAGAHDNEPIVAEMLRLRAEQARLLGFSSALELKLSRRMAGSVEPIEDFLGHLADRARPAAQLQLDELTAFAVEHGGPDRLEPWDIGYWSEKMRETQLGLSQDKLKPWFELERILAGLFELAQRLFGIDIEQRPEVECWQPDVRYYKVSGGGDGIEAGIYIDLYARSGKQGGAWMDVCRQRMHIEPDPVRGPVAYLTCNFAAPSAGHPSLLTHDDVVTLFHEFGHCLHHLLTRVDWPPVAGISGVEWDAVELPSQLFEGWTWESEFLQRHARHHETGEPLPATWIQALNSDRKFLGALALLRQIEFARTDLELHREAADHTGPDAVAIQRRIHDRVAVTPMPEYNRYLMSFSHLFDGGYAAGYYSYLWAERLARDAFELFREHGLYDADLGARLRDEILGSGGSRPMAQSWQAFVGRAPQLEPLLEAYGVGKNSVA